MRVPPDQSSTAADARVERAVGVAHAELVRDARQARAEGERLDAAVRRDRRVQVLQQHPRVRRHRARHVADEHELARALGGLAPAALERLAAVAQRRADRRAAGRAARRAGASRAVRRDRARRPAPGEAARGAARACARSASVYSAKSLSRSSSTSLHAAGRISGSPTLFGWAPSGGGAATRGTRELRRPAACPRGRASTLPASPNTAAKARRRPEVGAPRAQHGAQREVGVAALRRRRPPSSARAPASTSPVPTRTPPARISAASVARRSSTAPLARRASAGTRRRVRHPRAPPARARARGPRAPSAPRRACRRASPFGRRARAAPAPRRSSPRRPGSL